MTTTWRYMRACAADVSSGACVACADGRTRPAGDDPMTSGDTTCACAADERVSSGACVACADGRTRPAGDDPMTSGDTMCACLADERQLERVRGVRARSINAAGDDPNGSDTECDWVGINNYQEFRGDVTRSPCYHILGSTAGTRRGTQRFFCDASGALTSVKWFTGLDGELKNPSCDVSAVPDEISYGAHRDQPPERPRVLRCAQRVRRGARPRVRQARRQLRVVLARDGVRARGRARGALRQHQAVRVSDGAEARRHALGMCHRRVHRDARLRVRHMKECAYRASAPYQRHR